MQIDLYYLVDAEGRRQWFLCAVDVATDYVVSRWIKNHEALTLWQAWCDAWVGWAGPPDIVVSDNERGFIASDWVDRASQSGSHVWPTAAYAPWQKARVERRISTLKETMKTVIMHRTLSGEIDMQLCAQEASYAYNQRPGGCGFSPAQRLFGTRPRAYADLYHNGEPAGPHPAAVDVGSDLARRLEIRRISQEVSERKAHEDMLARAAAARSRVLTTVTTGQRVYFYRAMTPAQKRKHPRELRIRPFHSTEVLRPRSVRTRRRNNNTARTRPPNHSRAMSNQQNRISYVTGRVARSFARRDTNKDSLTMKRRFPLLIYVIAQKLWHDLKNSNEPTEHHALWT